jgi:hypothetical protein
MERKIIVLLKIMMRWRQIIYWEKARQNSGMELPRNVKKFAESLWEEKTAHL